MNSTPRTSISSSYLSIASLAANYVGQKGYEDNFKAISYWLIQGFNIHDAMRVRRIRTEVQNIRKEKINALTGEMVNRGMVNPTRAAITAFFRDNHVRLKQPELLAVYQNTRQAKPKSVRRTYTLKGRHNELLMLLARFMKRSDSEMVNLLLAHHADFLATGSRNTPEKYFGRLAKVSRSGVDRAIEYLKVLIKEKEK